MVHSFVRLLKLLLIGSFILPMAVATCSLVFFSRSVTAADLQTVHWPGIAMGTLLLAVGYVVLSKSGPWLTRVSKRQASYLDRFRGRSADLAIVAAAGVGLLLELALIRLQASEFPVLSFYKNMGLLACFAGLGLGYALARRGQVPLVLVIPLLVWQLGLITLLRRCVPVDLLWSLRATPTPEQLNMGLAVASSVSQYVAIYLLLGVLFLLTAVTFIPIGQACGRLMERRGELRAYGLNLVGSVVGVGVMLAISSRWAPPAVWFALAFAVLVFLQASSRRSLLCGVTASLAFLTLLAWPMTTSTQSIYSPYQLIERSANERGLLKIRAAGLYHQQVHDLSTTNVARSDDPDLKSIADYYDLPYRLHGDANRVAIVGAGTGNDVAGALRAGASHVDAVEIDPAILKLGEVAHPERPYSDARVQAHVNDARSFFRSTESTYDLIVYGLLDSHGLLSHASSVRLDSFVYTVEGMREARQRLRPGGMLCLSFCAMSPEMSRKIHLMMKEAFDGRPPLCLAGRYDGAEVFVQSRDAEADTVAAIGRARGFDDISERYADTALIADVSTDDWPFFYMPRRVYPSSYLIMLAMVVGLAAFLNRSFIKEMPQRKHLAFFFLGAGFMLIETKAITELGLMFGNTWQVIGIVIIGVLVMALLANCAVAFLRIQNAYAPFVLLLASVVGGYAVARSGGFVPTTIGKLVAVVVLTIPMFFSGMIFSTLLRKHRSISAVMSLNIFGAMCGGVLEYNAMYFGYQFLYLLAFGVYGLAFLSMVLMTATARRPAASSAPLGGMGSATPRLQ